MRYPVKFCGDQVINPERSDRAIAYSKIEITAVQSRRNRVFGGI